MRVMYMLEGVRMFYVKGKKSCAAVKMFGNNGYEVIYCSNKRMCRNMGISKCPPYCEKIVAVKNYYLHGRLTRGFEVTEIQNKTRRCVVRQRV
jgi:hypothetical protein